MYTEEEAKQKWCPEVRMGNPNGGGFNSDIQTPEAEYYKCIASDCMMWRWVKGRDSFKENDAGYSKLSGYCGKSGKP